MNGTPVTLAFAALAEALTFGEAFADTTTISLQSGGETRTSIVHSPAGYIKSTSYPLMLVFHGSGGTGVSMERVTGFDDVADKLGFIVAYRIVSARDGGWDRSERITTRRSSRNSYERSVAGILWISRGFISAAIRKAPA